MTRGDGCRGLRRWVPARRPSSPCSARPCSPPSSPTRVIDAVAPLSGRPASRRPPAPRRPRPRPPRRLRRPTQATGRPDCRLAGLGDHRGLRRARAADRAGDLVLGVLALRGPWPRGRSSWPAATPRRRAGDPAPGTGGRRRGPGRARRRRRRPPPGGDRLLGPAGAGRRPRPARPRWPATPRPTWSPGCSTSTQVSAPVLDGLAEVYREARFATHAVDADDTRPGPGRAAPAARRTGRGAGV